jgi:hypothetical protein
MSQTDANTKEKVPEFVVSNNLVSCALTEFRKNNHKFIEEHLSRAEALLTRIAPDFVALAEIYLDDDRVMRCDIEGIQEGFGLLSLRFNGGHFEEDDYFQIDNYLELDSSFRIYCLYDLGEALLDITETAQIALQSFREFRSSPSRSASGCEVD